MSALMGLLFFPNIVIANNNSNIKAKVPNDLSYLQISLDDWKNNKEIKQTKTGQIDKIIDPLTLLLKDGTIIRLASIDVPMHKHENDFDALSYLKELLRENTKVFIFQTRQAKSGRINRMDHQLAHIVTQNDHIWIQGSMLKNGFARLYTAPKHDELLNEMIMAENIAITHKNNLWSDTSQFKILTPLETSDNLGNFSIIEGTIQKVATVRNNVYLNFGKDWKTDFTVMVSPMIRKDFARQNIDLLSLGNQAVRVRGWLREYNGAFIELEDTAHLQILDNPSNLDKNNTIENEE